MRFVSLSVCCVLVTGSLSGTAYAQPTDDCYSAGGTQDVAYIESNYPLHSQTLAVQQTPVDATTSWICVYVGLGLRTGGRFIVTGLALTPTLDSDASVCPPSSDVLAGQVGDPANPSTYVPYRVATTTNSSAVTVCVTLGAMAVRVTYPVVSGAPTVDFLPNSGSSFAPPPRVGAIRAGVASFRCSGWFDVNATDDANLVWYSLIGGWQGFVQFAGDKVCYRTITPATAQGGLVTFTAGSYDIWVPVEKTGSSSGCTTTLFATTAPVQTEIMTGSAPGQTWICAWGLGMAASVVARTDARAPQVLTPPGVRHDRD